MAFIHEDFLLQSTWAKRLYHEWAEDQPILDFHNHLPVKDIAENRRFGNLFEIWLEGDHYKWRAMRANGVPECFCTGNESAYDKFLAWARTVPATLRNPLYHWTHLELKRYFGIECLLDQNSAAAIWQEANAQLGTESMRAQCILKKFKVEALCTTDDPADDLKWHEQIAATAELKVYPTFRPDKALAIDKTGAFNEWIDRLSQVSNIEIDNLGHFLDALRSRHDEFHRLGARVSDHGLSHCYTHFCSEDIASSIFARARGGETIRKEKQQVFASFMMLFFGQLDAEKGWTKQLHLGARRNSNSRALEELGPDTGFDSIGDWPQVDALGVYLDRLNREHALPKMIVYNLNPADNYAIATLLGNFQDGSSAGKIQLGSGWWFLDQKEGIEWQLNTLSHVGLLSRFVGMVTDSRSFMSFPRHEYFRRVLCNLVGKDLEMGELPQDFEFVGKMVREICYQNSRHYLVLPER
jgi:glucuronate isomerase